MYILGKLIEGKKMKTFSAMSRNALLERLQRESYDVLIVGGGITGAGIALDAISRGLSVALVEQQDFGGGTSSRSTKLIHGGLRYLKQLEFQLVREVARERAIIYKNARHIVSSEPMMIPIQKNGSMSKFFTSLGLKVYDYLAQVRKEECRKMLSRERAIQEEPLLAKSDITAAGLYSEYRTDDARLTIENIKTAFKLGANCINYLEVVEYIEDEKGQICGARLLDNLTQKSLAVKAKVIVNATGPWVDNLLQLDKKAKSDKKLILSKGVHLVLPRTLFPLRQSIYFDVAGDDRMIFAIPRGSITYIGTTDTHYEGDIANPIVERSDVHYILDAVNAMFDGVNLGVGDVISSWAGLRPLVLKKGKKTSELSRKDEIFINPNGLITIAGGKLTGYRKMAERTTNILVSQLRKKAPHLYQNLKSCSTDTISLFGNFSSQKEMEDFIIDRQGVCKQILLSPKEVLDLVWKYGKETDVIIERAFALYPHIQDPKRRILAAELWYSVCYEMSNTLSDFLIRRTGRLYFERPDLVNNYEYIGEQMAKLLAWSDATKNKFISEMQHEIDRVVAFKDRDELSVA